MTLNIITDWYLNWPGLVIKVQGSINCFQQTTQQQFTMHLTSYLHSMYEVSITYICTREVTLTLQSSSRLPNKSSGSANIRNPSTWAFFNGSM